MAVVVPFAFLASASGAAAPPIDVANDQVTCNTINKGVIKLKPGFTFGEFSKPGTVSVQGYLGGCSDRDNPSVTFPDFKSSFKGTLNTTPANCGALAGSTQQVTGTITVKWNTDQKITPATSTIAVNTAGLGGGSFAAPWGGTYGYPQLGSPAGDPLAVSGAFTGGDGGATSTTDLVTQEDVFGVLIPRCSSANGLKSVTVGIGQLHLR
jgi:hypothetical protein